MLRGGGAHSLSLLLSQRLLALRVSLGCMNAFLSQRSCSLSAPLREECLTIQILLELNGSRLVWKCAAVGLLKHRLLVVAMKSFSTSKLQDRKDSKHFG